MKSKLSLTFLISTACFALPLFAQTKQSEITTLVKQGKHQQSEIKALEIKLAQIDKRKKVVQTRNVHKTYNIVNKKKAIKAKLEKPLPKYEFKINGLINVGTMFANDGFENNLFFIGDQQFNTRLNFIGIVRPNEDWTITGEIQLGLRVNASNVVSQNNPSPGTQLRVRKAQLISRGKGVGTFYIGRGDTILFGNVKSDLSGTVVVGNVEVQKIGGGLFMRQFGNGNDFVASQQINNIYSIVNTYRRRSRFRYDTPHFDGFYLSADAVEDSRFDAGLFYRNALQYAKIAAAASFLNKQDFNVVGGTLASGPQYAGTISVLFNCGFNVTGVYSLVDAREGGRTDPSAYYGKLGYQAHWFEIGKTAISADYAQYRNDVMNGDRGQSIGADVVQYFPKIKLQVYAGYRHYKFSRTNTNFRTMNYGVIGLLYRLGQI